VQAPVTAYDIVAVPLLTPVTTPVVLTEATVASEVLQVPPGTVSDNAEVAAGQMVVVPLITPAFGAEITDIGAVV
jgi:hypothetical protein